MDVGTVVAITSLGFTLLTTIIGGIVKLNTLKADLDKERELRIAGDTNLKEAAIALDAVYNRRHEETRETLTKMDSKLDTLLSKVR